jgi:hypothetical protein
MSVQNSKRKTDKLKLKKTLKNTIHVKPINAAEFSLAISGGIKIWLKKGKLTIQKGQKQKFRGQFLCSNLKFGSVARL